MHIHLSPVRHDAELFVSKVGDVLTINSVPFDFSSIVDGGSRSSEDLNCDWIVGDVRRIDGIIHLTLILPHGPAPSENVAFPATLVNPEDGNIVLPSSSSPETAD